MGVEEEIWLLDDITDDGIVDDGGGEDADWGAGGDDGKREKTCSPKPNPSSLDMPPLARRHL